MFRALELDSTMPFGKHQGTTLRTLITKDKWYCRWMLEQGINLSESVKESIKQGKVVELVENLSETLEKIHDGMVKEIKALYGKVPGYPRIDTKYRCLPKAEDFDKDVLYEWMDKEEEANIISKLFA